jgi:uncharacterized protein (TIGR00251 family)
MTEIYVKAETDAKRFDVETGPMLKVSLTEKAENGRANAELIRELGEILGEKISIIKGHKSSRKKIRVEASKEEVDEKVEKWAKQR